MKLLKRLYCPFHWMVPLLRKYDSTHVQLQKWRLPLWGDCSVFPLRLILLHDPSSQVIIRLAALWRGIDCCNERKLKLLPTHTMPIRPLCTTAGWPLLLIWLLLCTSLAWNHSRFRAEPHVFSIYTVLKTDCTNHYSQWKLRDLFRRLYLVCQKAY
jgi:hypothetical protein